MSLYEYVQHPHIRRRRAAPPVKAADHYPGGRFNTWLAIKISGGVGTMWCAYLFAAIALVSLPAALRSGQLIIIVAWVAQTFLQLVLLSIIIVGQKVQGAASDQRAEQTYLDAEAVLHTALQIEEHLQAQDTFLGELAERIAATPTAARKGKR
jgi:hypothetical protein